MTEPKAKSELKKNEKPAQQPIAVRSENGAIRSARFHFFADCPKIVRTDMEALEPVNEREIGLLGLKPCAACERRQSGGPVIEALGSILNSSAFQERFSVGEPTDTAAWFVVNELKDRGFYVAQRGVRKAE